MKVCRVVLASSFGAWLCASAGVMRTNRNRAATQRYIIQADGTANFVETLDAEQSSPTYERVSWRMCNDDKDPTKFYSNLAGKGPDKDGPQEFRLGEIAEIHGTKVDLVITVADGEDYKTFAQARNRDYGGAYVAPCPTDKCKKRKQPQRTGNCWGELPIHVQTHTKFHWKWVKSNTNIPFKMERFELTFYELDHERNNWDGLGPDHEYLEFNTPVSSMEHGSRVNRTHLPNDRIQSMEQGGWRDNLATVGEMTSVQKERRVTAVYENMADWYVTFGHEGPKTQRFDRIVEFAGAVYVAPSPPCKSEPVSFHLCGDDKKATQFNSNLAGMGPDGDKPQEFRLKEVAEMQGEKLDLVVTVANGEQYRSFAQEKKRDFGGAYVSPCPKDKCTKRPEPETGLCWGELPIYVQTHTKFNWKWVKTNTNTTVRIEKFELTFYDLDRERDDWDGLGPDNEYLEFNTPVSSLAHGSRVQQVDMPGGVHKVQSKEHGPWEDNVAKMGRVSTIQRERNVTASYRDIGEWYITFGHEGPKTQRFDRVVEFTGVVYTTCPTPPPSCTPKTVSWRMCDHNKDPIEFYSNLAGKGPNKNEAEEFRLKEVAVVNGVKLDMVVTVAEGEDYQSFHQDKHADAGGAYVSPCPTEICKKKPEPQRTGTCLGLLPIFVHTHTKFHWTWVKSQTSEVYPLEKFDLTFYELDRERDDWDGLGSDNEYLEFNTPVTKIEHGPRVEQIEMPEGIHKIQSREKGDVKDNPSKMGAISTLQKERSVTVSYEKRGDFDITFGHKGPKTQRFDRVVEFTGSVYTCA